MIYISCAVTSLSADTPEPEVHGCGLDLYPVSKHSVCLKGFMAINRLNRSYSKRLIVFFSATILTGFLALVSLMLIFIKIIELE